MKISLDFCFSTSDSTDICSSRIKKIEKMAMPKKKSVTTTNLRNMFDKKVFPTWQGRKVGFLF